MKTKLYWVEMGNIHILDIIIIALYLILCLAIGLYKAGKIKTIKEYTLGSGYISTAVLMFTIFATYIGAGSTVGTVEKIYSMGLIFAVTLLLQPLFWCITAKIFAYNIPIFKKAGCMSVSDIMGALYGKAGKWVTNVFSIFLSITYSMFGGIRAVALTDTFQGLVILVAIPVACAIAFHEVGGYDGMMDKLPLSHLSIDFTEANSLFLASMLFYGLLPVSEGTFIQRFLMATDSDQLNRALRVVAVISLPLALVIGLIGFIVKVKAPAIDPNIAFFYLIGHYLPIGITGLLISGILAAIMSSADSWLNTASVLCAHDIAKGIFPKLTDKHELFIARVSVLIISALSMFLASTSPSLMGLIWLADNFWLPVILIPLIFGFFKFQTNQKSFISSSILGASGAFLGRYIMGEFATISMVLGMMGSAIGLLVMHYWQVYSGRDVSNALLSSRLANSLSLKKKDGVLKILQKNLASQVVRYRQYGYVLGGLGMIYFLGSSFFMAFTDSKILYTIVYLKAAAAILCFGLCILDFHLNQKQQEKYVPIYWCITLLYCFPFLSAYIALIYNGGTPWIINLMLSTILLYIFAGWFSAGVLSVIGFCAAYMLFKYTGYSLALDGVEQPKLLGYIYCFLTGAIALILKQRDMLQERDLQTRMLYGAAVAHEVINPLQGSAMMADVLVNAFKGKSNVNDIKQADFDDIKKLLKPFKESSLAALKTVDRMLTLVRTDISEADDISIYNINDCVNKALKSYGFSDKNLKRIEVKRENSFEFKGSKHFICHVLNNLISNALKYTGSHSKIQIWYEGRELHFKDNGPGIESERISNIFEAFDKKGRIAGTGVGLPFCKRVMESMGGSIECISELGSGAEFVLKFEDIRE